MFSQMDFINDIAQVIFDKKGFNILVLDVRELSTLTDFFIIAEGNVDRHVKALSNDVIEKMRTLGHRPAHVDGDKDAEWIVIDYLDIIIHLFIPPLREKYHLEDLWKKAKIVPLELNLG